MGWIRGLVYRAGIRPRPGSIFYSPSRDLALSMRGIHNGFLSSVAVVMAEVQRATTVPIDTAAERISAHLKESTMSDSIGRSQSPIEAFTEAAVTVSHWATLLPPEFTEQTTSQSIQATTSLIATAEEFATDARQRAAVADDLADRLRAVLRDSSGFSTLPQVASTR